MKKGDFLFVYGTLRSGESAERLVAPGSDYIGEDKINGMIYSLGGFPGLKVRECHGDTNVSTFNPEAPVVVGDIFCLRSDTVACDLDRYEGYPSLYDRIMVKTEAGIQVWCYIYNGRVYPEQLIESGDWKARVVKTSMLSLA